MLFLSDFATPPPLLLHPLLLHPLPLHPLPLPVAHATQVLQGARGDRGLNNIPMTAPIALRAIGLGYSDGHVADLYSAGSGSVFGLVSPLTWMRQAVSPFVDLDAAEYRFTEGVLAVTSARGGKVEVKKFRSEHKEVAATQTDWAMWLYFSPEGSAKLSLSVADQPGLCSSNNGGNQCHWFMMEGDGTARALADCTDDTECTLDAFVDIDPALAAAAAGGAPAFAGAVLVVGAAAADPAHNVTDATGTTLQLPPTALTLARLELASPTQPKLALTICNTGDKPLNNEVTISYQETEVRLREICDPADPTAVALLPRTVEYQVSAYSCRTVKRVFNMSSFELPLHVFLNGGDGLGLVADLRRLIPVPIADPNFRFRRFGSGIVPRPADTPKPPLNLPAPGAVPGGAAGGGAGSTAAAAKGAVVDNGGPFVMLIDDDETSVPYRNIYWPPNTPGTVHVRLFAMFGASSAATTVPLAFGLESWRIDGNWSYTHSFPRCVGSATVGRWSTVALPIWGGGVSSVSWIVLRAFHYYWPIDSDFSIVVGPTTLFHLFIHHT